MVLQAAGPITLSNIATEFLDTAPFQMSEFYAGGNRVPASVTGVPTTGLINIAAFLGKANSSGSSSTIITGTGSNSIYYGITIPYTGAGYLEFSSNASTAPIVGAMSNFNYFFVSSITNNINKRVNLYSSVSIIGTSNYRVSFTPSTTTYPANTYYTLYFTSNVYMSSNATNYWYHRTADDQARTINDINSADKLTYVWSLAGSILSTYPGYHLFRSQRDATKYIRHAGLVMWFQTGPTNYDFPYKPEMQSDHTIRFRNPYNLTYWLTLDTTDTTRLKYNVSGSPQSWNMYMVDSYLPEAVGAIGSLAATNIKTTSLTLSWTANASYVNISWTGGAGGSATNITASTYNVTGLTIGTSYTFTVTPYLNSSVGTAGTLTVSTASSITVGTLTTTKVATTSLNIAWNTGTYDYVIVTWDNGGTSGQQTGSSYVVTGLTANTQYTFSVTPYNTLNASGTAQTTTITTAAALSGGTISASSITTTGMTLTWNGTAYYYVIITWSPGNGSSGQVSTSSYNVSGLTFNTSYTFTLTPYSYENVAGPTSTLTQSTLSGYLDILSASAKTYIKGIYACKTIYSTYTGPLFAVRRSSDNATNSFYADTQGNLVDSNSQSFTTWAGADTIYITTWYDQSGLNNHATQTNTATQPILTYSTKSINFRTSRFFNLPNGTVPSGNSSYTITCKHGSMDGANIFGSGTYNSTSAVLALERTTFYNNYWWSNDFTFGTYAANNVVTIKYDNSNTGRYGYVNGTAISNLIGGAARNSTTINNTIGSDLRNGTTGTAMNGDLYYIVFFSAPLADADRQILESVP